MFTIFSFDMLLAFLILTDSKVTGV